MVALGDVRRPTGGIRVRRGGSRQVAAELVQVAADGVPAVALAEHLAQTVGLAQPGGSASLETVEGVPPEYLEAARKQVGEAGMPAFEAQVRGLYQQMVRITIEPRWAKLLDFQTRLPTPVEDLIKRMSAAAG